MMCKALGCPNPATDDGLCLGCSFWFNTTDVYSGNGPSPELSPEREGLRADLELVTVELARLTRQLADTMDRLRVVAEEQKYLAESILRSTEPS
jgi:hypothetical protein